MMRGHQVLHKFKLKFGHDNPVLQAILCYFDLFFFGVTIEWMTIVYLSPTPTLTEDIKQIQSIVLYKQLNWKKKKKEIESAQKVIDLQIYICLYYSEQTLKLVPNNILIRSIDSWQL